MSENIERNLHEMISEEVRKTDAVAQNVNGAHEDPSAQELAMQAIKRANEDADMDSVTSDEEGGRDYLVEFDCRFLHVDMEKRDPIVGEKMKFLSDVTKRVFDKENKTLERGLQYNGQHSDQFDSEERKYLEGLPDSIPLTHALILKRLINTRSQSTITKVLYSTYLMDYYNWASQTQRGPYPDIMTPERLSAFLRYYINKKYFEDETTLGEFEELRDVTTATVVDGQAQLPNTAAEREAEAEAEVEVEGDEEGDLEAEIHPKVPDDDEDPNKAAIEAATAAAAAAAAASATPDDESMTSLGHSTLDGSSKRKRGRPIKNPALKSKTKFKHKRKVTATGLSSRINQCVAAFNWIWRFQAILFDTRQLPDIDDGEIHSTHIEDVEKISSHKIVKSTKKTLIQAANRLDAANAAATADTKPRQLTLPQMGDGSGSNGLGGLGSSLDLHGRDANGVMYDSAAGLMEELRLCREENAALRKELSEFRQDMRDMWTEITSQREDSLANKPQTPAPAAE